MSTPNPEMSQQAARLYTQGQFEQAQRLYEKMLEDEPENFQVLVMMGLCRRGLRDMEGSLGYLRRAVRHGDGNPETHYYLGRVLMESGQSDAARAELAQALALNPNHVQARTLKGMISLLAGEHARASEELHTALRANPRHVPALALAARACLETGAVDKAYQHASRALELAPADAAAQSAMGKVLQAQGHLDFAEQCYRNALDKQAGNPELHAGLGSVLQDAGRHAEALEHFQQALQTGYGGAALVTDMAVSLARLERFDEARQLLEQGRARWPGHGPLGLALAEARLEAGDPAGARELLEELEPRSSQVRLLKARVAHALSEAETAEALLIELSEDEQPEAQRQARLLRARLAIEDGAPDKAREALDALVARTPPDTTAVLMQVEIEQRQGETRKAAELLEDLLERGRLDSREKARVHQLAGQSLDKLENYERAAGHLARSGWRTAPFLPIRAIPQTEDGTLQAWMDWDGSLIDAAAPDDGRTAPVIVLGWPGSGRELILAAIAELPGVRVLDPSTLDRRRESLYLPVTPEQVFGMTEATLVGARKRFLRGVEAGSGPVLETGWWETSALPALARAFPGLKVIVPFAPDKDLELHWRMLGLDQIERMREVYGRERDLYRHLQPRLPAEFILVRRAELLADPEKTLGELCPRLGTELDAGGLERFELLRANQPYREVGHWKHYTSILGRPAGPGGG